MSTKKGMKPNSPAKTPTRKCLCSPTNHPGSFRCHLHRNSHSVSDSLSQKKGLVSSQNYLELVVMAKADSLKAFLVQMIKPSSHHLQRRMNFHPKPSRFYHDHHHHHLHRQGLPVS